MCFVTVEIHISGISCMQGLVIYAFLILSKLTFFDALESSDLFIKILYKMVKNVFPYLPYLK